MFHDPTTGVHPFVVVCKGCQQNIPAPVETLPDSWIIADCPLCGARRRYFLEVHASSLRTDRFCPFHLYEDRFERTCEPYKRLAAGSLRVFFGFPNFGKDLRSLLLDLTIAERKKFEAALRRL
jgi:hypothetical protein